MLGMFNKTSKNKALGFLWMAGILIVAGLVEYGMGVLTSRIGEGWDGTTLMILGFFILLPLGLLMVLVSIVYFILAKINFKYYGNLPGARKLTTIILILTAIATIVAVFDDLQ